MKRINLNS